jgi:hypothetical protein
VVLVGKGGQEMRDTQFINSVIIEVDDLPEDLKSKLMLSSLVDIFNSGPSTAIEASHFLKEAKKILNNNEDGKCKNSILRDKDLIIHFVEALNELKDIEKRKKVIKIARILGIAQIIENTVKESTITVENFEYSSRYEILRKPRKCVRREPIRRSSENRKFFQILSEDPNAPKRLSKQLKIVREMWERFEASMQGGPRYDVLIFSIEERMYNINKIMIEALRGVAYHEDTIVVLIISPDDYFKDNLNSTIEDMKITRDRVFPKISLNPRFLRINYIKLAGRGTRNEPFTHALGLGSKHLMPSPSAFSYLVATIIQSYEVFKEEPHWLGRFNDQIVLITNPDIFAEPQGLITGGIRYTLVSDMLNNCAHSIRNTCFMRLNKDNLVVVAREKPKNLGNDPEDKNGLVYYMDEEGKVATSSSVRRFTAEAVDVLIEEFTKVNALTKNYIHSSFRLSENTILVGGSTFTDEERDEFWATHQHCVASDARYEDVIATIDAARKFRERVGIGFGDFGDENEARSLHLGENASYYHAFARLEKDKALQALLDVIPDTQGNVIINCSKQVHVLLQNRTGVVASYCPNLESGDIADGSVILNVLARNIVTRGKCLVGPVFEEGKVIQEGEVFSQIYQRDMDEPIDVRWKIEDDPRDLFGRATFGPDCRSFEEVKQKQDKQRTMSLLSIFM